MWVIDNITNSIFNLYLHLSKNMLKKDKSNLKNNLLTVITLANRSFSSHLKLSWHLELIL